MSLRVEASSAMPLEKIQDLNTVLASRFGHSLSKFEVRRSLEPTMQKIEREMAEKFRLLNILKPTLINSWYQVKQYPLLSGGKLMAACVLAYLLRNIFRGIIGGEVLFKDIPFSQIFSSNKDTRLNAGQYLTNAANNASFTMDGLWMIYGIYYLFLRTPYQRAASQTIQEVYHVNMESGHLSRAQMDELYDMMIREMNNYQGFGFDTLSEIKTPLEMIKIEKNPSDDECICPSRSKLEVRKSLERILQDIRKEIGENSSLWHLLGIIVKNCYEDVKEKPWASIGKLIVLLGIGYMLKNIFIGICSGEELFYDVPFKDVFASNVTDQEIAAGYLTNAASNASFTLDGAFMLYIGYMLLLDGSYNKAMKSIINESVSKVLKDKNLPLEELNEIYQIINRELDSYGGYGTSGTKGTPGISGTTGT